jgi:hypothetical protein
MQCRFVDPFAHSSTRSWHRKTSRVNGNDHVAGSWKYRCKRSCQVSRGSKKNSRESRQREEMCLAAFMRVDLPLPILPSTAIFIVTRTFLVMTRTEEIDDFPTTT